MMAEEDFQDLRSTIEQLEERIEADIQDVRERVIQVKRETDTKAPADHTHEGLQAQIETLEADLQTVQEETDRTESRMEGGFENFEEILQDVFERTDELETDVKRIKAVLTSVRQTLDNVSEREQERARADHLKKTAAARGVRTAKCQSCNRTIDIALLSKAECPSCGEQFHTLDANPGFFGTSYLETGHRPALEGESTETRPNLNADTGDESKQSEADKTPFNWHTTDENGGE